jgi:hypothetical protein
LAIIEWWASKTTTRHFSRPPAIAMGCFDCFVYSMAYLSKKAIDPLVMAEALEIRLPRPYY